MPKTEMREPWNSFLRDLDNAATEEVTLHCIGGFIVTELYGLNRQTGDVDAILIAPNDQRSTLLEKGRKYGPLHKKHGVYLDFVTVSLMPYDYDERLTFIFAGMFEHLRLFAVDPYDLALSKLARNNEKDRFDFAYLARTLPFNFHLLRERYEKEMRPYLGNPEREDLTLRLWIEAFQEASGS